MPWELVEYKGKVAVTMGWELDFDKPIAHRSLWINPHEKWDAEYHTRFVELRLWMNNVFTAVDRNTYGNVTLDTNGWQCVQEEQPVKPPGRGGKSWRWAWSFGKWNKRYI